VWERVFQHLAEDADNEYAMIDATIVRAHQHSAGAKGGARHRSHWSQQRRIEYKDSCHRRGCVAEMVGLEGLIFSGFNLNGCPISV
jgi:hypothetical protein